MRRFSQRRQLLLALTLTLLAPLAHASVQIVVDGVDDSLKGAVTACVELSQYATRDASAAQVRSLYEKAPDQVRVALQPYGYYDATTTGSITQAGKNWLITLHVNAGAPVKVTEVKLTLEAQASAIAPVRRAMRALERLKNQPLNDGAYTRTPTAHFRTEVFVCKTDRTNSRAAGLMFPRSTL